MLVDGPAVPYATTNSWELSDDMTTLLFVVALLNIVGAGIEEQGYAHDQNPILPAALQGAKATHTPAKYVVSDIASAPISWVV